MVLAQSPHEVADKILAGATSSEVNWVRYLLSRTWLMARILSSLLALGCSLLLLSHGPLYRVPLTFSAGISQEKQDPCEKREPQYL